MPEAVPGFCKVATLDEVKEHNWALTPGLYVGAEDLEDGGEPFDERFPRLSKKLMGQFDNARALEKEIRKNLELAGYADEQS